MGGAGIVVGLATYGYNIMATLGIGMAKVTFKMHIVHGLATIWTQRGGLARACLSVGCACR